MPSRASKPRPDSPVGSPSKGECLEALGIHLLFQCRYPPTCLVAITFLIPSHLTSLLLIRQQWRLSIESFWEFHATTRIPTGGWEAIVGMHLFPARAGWVLHYSAPLFHYCSWGEKGQKLFRCLSRQALDSLMILPLSLPPTRQSRHFSGLNRSMEQYLPPIPNQTNP
jgi:hypothetical protein